MSAKSAFNRTQSFATRLALFSMMFGTAGIASAQTNTNWLGGVSNWNNAANWSGGFVPNNGNGGQNWNVFIDNGLVGNAVVAFDLSSTVNQVNISTGDTLNILDNRSLGIAQSISNDGFINLLAAGNTTQMSFSPSSTINGTGVIALSGSSARIIGSGTLTQGAGHTIQGNGSIGVNTIFINNQGLFLANGGDNLTIDVANAGGGVAAFTNDGFVRASGGGIVTLTGSGAGEFHGGGVYEAHAGSRINLIQDVIMANTTISTMGNGTIRSVSGHAASLANVTNLGSLVREDNGSLTISGSFVNSGNVSVAAAGNVTDLVFNGPVNVTGNGTMSMSGVGARLRGSGTVTQAAGHTIQGNGNAGTNTIFINNQGLFLANAAGDNLTIDVANAGGGVAAFTNDGFVRASAGGIVTLTGSGAGEFHGSGTYEALAGSQIRLIQDAVLASTTLSTGGNGTILVLSGHNASLVNVTNLGNIVRDDNGTLGIGGPFVNSGNVSVVGAGNTTQIFVSGAVNLSGAGSINMSGTGARIAGAGGGSILTNVDNTISGSGNAGANVVMMINQATFQAGAGESLTIDPLNAGGGIAAFANSGIVRATGGGVVTLTGSGAGEFHGAPGGLFEAQASSRMDLVSDVVVRNATLSTVGDGLIRLVAGHNAAWDGVTNTGNFRKDDNGTLTLVNNLTNSGNMQFVGAGNFTQMFVSGSVNLGGGGTVNLSGANARIIGAGGGSILTNVDNTISGTGNVGANSMAMINQSTIQAGAGESLTIDPVNLGGGNPAFTNSGVVRATGGGVVTLTGSGAGEFHGAPGGLFEAQASSRMDLVSDVVVRNATLSTVGDGLIRLVAGHNAAWDGVTNTGNFRKDDNGTLTLVNNLTNSGNMQFVGAGNFTQMFVSGSVNLGGGGTVNLSGTNARIIGAGGGSILTNVDNTISGTGNVGANSMAVINQGTIQSGAGESLTIDPLNAGAGNSTFTNDGVVRATGGGTVILTGSGAGEFSGNGTFEALNGSNVLFDGSAIVQNISGGTLNSGTWRAIDGGAGANVRVQNNATSQINTIGTNAAVELAGVNSQFTVRSTNIAIDSSLSTVNGTLILRDGRDMTVSGGLTNNGSLQVDGATSSLNVTAGFQQNSGSTSLTNGGVLALNGASNNIDGGTLEGIGNVIGDLTFGTAATLNPGFSPGQLDFTGDLTWDDGGLVFFDLGTNAPTSDFLAVSGNLIKGINGTFAFTFLNNNWVAGQTYDLMSFASTTFSAGDFSYTNGPGFTGTFAITGGNMLQFNLISAVPEPGVISVLLLAGFAGSFMVRRRRKQLI